MFDIYLRRKFSVWWPFLIFHISSEGAYREILVGSIVSMPQFTVRFVTVANISRVAFADMAFLFLLDLPGERSMLATEGKTGRGLPWRYEGHYVTATKNNPPVMR